MHNLIPFQFDNTTVSVIVDDSGEPWFNVKDICDVLGFGNHRQALSSHVDDDDVQKLDAIDSMGRTQSVSHVNESGMYALVFGSTKEEAKRFKRWVTREVLPSIRKHGSYSAQPVAHQTTVQVAEYVELLKRSAELEALKAANHKADYCAQVALSLLDSGLNRKEIAAIAGITPEAVDYFAKLAEEGRVAGNLFHVCAQR